METFHSTFERTLNSNDCKQNIPFSIQVPAGTAQLQLRLNFAPSVVDQIRNLLTLTVFDPSGWRGEGHRGGNLHEVRLNATQATPGYLPGPIQPGTWTVTVNTHMIMPGPVVQMLLDVSGNDQPAGEFPKNTPAGQTASRGPGWYRGDLHAHSLHSDASWDINALVAFARAQRLDFTTLSDHNTIAGLAEMDAARSNDLLTIGGMELTTFWGHALVLGLREWLDWRGIAGAPAMDEIQAEVTRRGATFIIAHPKAVGDPACTGCNWLYPKLMPGATRTLEVWNSAWTSDSNNEDGLNLAYEWLNQGQRLALTAGSDRHGSHSAGPANGYNVVYANELSEIEILRAVRAGHLYLSNGPALELGAAMRSEHAMMGDVLDTQANDSIHLSARWDACPPGTQLALIVDGQSIESFSAQTNGSKTWEINRNQTHWGLVTLRDEHGSMLALTNPIFWDGRA